MTQKYKIMNTKNSKSWTEWTNPVMTGYKMACCDCGLVHILNFKVIKVIKRLKGGGKEVLGLPKKDYQVIFKARRNEKETKKLSK